MISFRRAIADAIFDASERNGCYPNDEDIVSVEFRKFCTEIDVTYNLSENDRWGDGTTDQVTIDAAPVLTALLQKVIDEEHKQERIAKIQAEGAS